MEKVVEVIYKTCGQKAQHVTRFDDTSQLSSDVEFPSWM